MNADVCDRCNAELHGAYCSHCGEKAGSNALFDSVVSYIPEYPLTIAKSLPLVFSSSRLVTAVEKGKVGLRQGLKLYGATIAAVVASNYYLTMNSNRVDMIKNASYAPVSMIVNALLFYPFHMLFTTEAGFKSVNKPLTIWLYYASAGVVATLAVAFGMKLNGNAMERSHAIAVMLLAYAVASVALRRFYGYIASARKIFAALFFCTAILGQLIALLIMSYVESVLILFRS